MSFWSHHPELLDELIFKELVRAGLAEEDEDPFEAVSRCSEHPDFDKMIMRADHGYWVGRKERRSDDS